MKKTIILLTFTFTLILGSYNTSFGQWYGTISLEQVRNLSFGTIAPGSSSGTVKIDENNNVTPSGVSLFLNDRNRAEFKINKRGFLPTTVSNITVSQSATLTRIGGGGSMQVVNITQPGFVNWYFGWFSNTRTFYIGGTLQVKPSNPPGNYSGTYTVTVTYN